MQCGWRHSVCVTEAGEVYTFGWSKYGQLGHGDQTDRLTAHKIDPGRMDGPVASVVGGWRHTVALTRSGRLYAWGWNRFGQLGCGDIVDRWAPVEIGAEVGPWTQARCGWRHTVALTASGRVLAWGRGCNGQLGVGGKADIHVPTEVEALRAGTKVERWVDVQRVGRAAGLLVPDEAPSAAPDAVPLGGGVGDEEGEPPVKKARTGVK